MITKIIFTPTLVFTMSTIVITAIVNTTTLLMTLPQAQQLATMLKEDGYHTWVVEGYAINMLLEGRLYTLTTAKSQPNEK